MEKQFFKKIMEAFACSDCGRYFPRSVLITLDSPFQEIKGTYCTICYHKIYDLIGFCDECGNEYPKQYLYASLFDKTVVCKECLQHEET